MSLDAELEALRKAPPGYVKAAESGRFKAMRKPPSTPPGYPDIGPDAKPPLKDAFETFHTARPEVLAPGTTIYRVLDPKSNDNSICWMTKAEFKQLRSKTDWRDRFAVWRNWNSNGEVVTYTVPPGKGLPVWRGATASQPVRDGRGTVVRANDQGHAFWLEGGAEQLVVNPADLQRSSLGRREYTGWGYNEGDIDVNLVGVPILQTNWREPR